MPLLFFKPNRPTNDREQKNENKTLAIALSYLDKNGHDYILVSASWKTFILDQMPIDLAHFNFHRFVVPQCQIFQKIPADKFQFSILSGGLTNFTFKLNVTTLEEEKPTPYVFRLPGTGSEKFIDRPKEKVHAEIASEANISPSIVFFDEKTGIQVSEFLQHPVPMSAETFKDPDNIKRAAELLRSLHDLEKPFLLDENAFQRNEKFLNLILAKTQLPPEYLPIKEEIDSIEGIVAELYKRNEIQKVPSHNDTTPPNFIITQGKMKLIDLEYAGQNDRLWDLATLSGEAEFTAEQENLLLQFYHKEGELTEDIKHRFHLYKPVVEYYTMLWCYLQLVNQNFIGKNGFDYLVNLGNKRFAQLKALLEEETVSEALSFFQNRFLTSYAISVNYTIPFEEITFGKSTGQGGNARVYKGTWHGLTIAIKELLIVPNGHTMQMMMQNFVREAQLMKSLQSSPSALKFFGITCSTTATTRFAMALEFLRGGDIIEWSQHNYDLDPHNYINLRFKVLENIAYDLVQIHHRHIVHRDFACQNIMAISKHSHKIKTIDYGHSLQFYPHEEEKITEKFVGIHRNAAPESINEHRYSYKTDIWSLGSIIYEISTGTSPFGSPDKTSDSEIAELVGSGETAPIPPNSHPGLANLIKWCWKKNPKQRPTAQQAYNTLHEIAEKECNPETVQPIGLIHAKPF